MARWNLAAVEMGHPFRRSAETLVSPAHFRLLVTGRPLDEPLIDTSVRTVQRSYGRQG